MHELEAAAREVVKTWETGDLARAVTILDGVLRDQEQNLSECGVAIARAREMYASDNCAIDPSPLVAPSDDGTYVAAWLWVPKP